MVLSEGFRWIYNDFQENVQPYRGWPEEWNEIKKELEKEFEKAMDVD